MWNEKTIRALSRAEFERLPLGERKLIVGFNSDELPFADLPHVITEFTRTFVEYVMQLKGCNPGMWNYPIPFDERGQDADVDLKELPFRAWSHPRNRERLLEVVDGIAICPYRGGMFICDSAVSAERVRQVLSDVQGADGHFSAGVWSTIPKLVQICEWVCFPLIHAESQVYATDPEHEDDIRAIEAWCRTRGDEFSRVERKEGRVVVVDYPARSQDRN
jgi:hypothetical protein